MRIEVLPKAKATDFTCDVPWAAISISTDYDWPELNEVNREGLLRLRFADTDKDDDGGITEDQAMQILIFVRMSVKSHQAETLLVHCLMGQSRSPAVAAAICNVLGEDDSYFFKKYTPNRKVYRTILQVAHERGYDEGRLLD